MDDAAHMLVIVPWQTLEGWAIPDPPPSPPVQAPALPVDLPRPGPLLLGADNAFLVTVTLIAIRAMSLPLELRLIAFMPGAAPIFVAGPATLSGVGESVTLDSGLIGLPLARARFGSTAGGYVFSAVLRTYRR